MKKNRIAWHPVYRKLYYLTHPWEIFDWLWRETHWFIQRGLYGFADVDTWALDHYLVRWLPSALRTMAKYAHGYPYEMKDVYEWKTTLREMADRFEQVDEGFENAHHPKDMKKYSDDALKLLSKWFLNLWD